MCANCYEGGASTTRHHSDHPMQCILTRSEFGKLIIKFRVYNNCLLSITQSYKLILIYYLVELYYGGEAVSVEQPQSLTCPYCTRMGFTEATLQEHVAADHSDTSFEVVCIL